MRHEGTKKLSAWLGGLLILMVVFPARGAASAPAAGPREDLKVFLLTMGPGDDVYEKFGHNAIWIHDAVAGTDRVFNYGLFDMGQSGFIWQFLRGRMMYWMEGESLEQQTLPVYSHLRRSILAQQLNMSPAQKVRLRDRLEWLAAQNRAKREYLYDYYRANCSTKVRDALDDALDGQLRKQLEPIRTGQTYRTHTRRIMQYNPLLYTALNAVLGQPTDREISAWEECFLPSRMADHLRNVYVVDEQGRLVPLINPKTEKMLIDSHRRGESQNVPNWIGWFAAYGVVVGFLLGMLGRGSRERKSARIVLIVLAGLWVFVLAFGAWFGLLFWCCSSHVATYRNENLMQVNSLMVTMLVLLPALTLGKRWARTPALVVAATIAVVSVVAAILKALPWFYQVNWEIIALMLPANLGLLGAVMELRKGRLDVTPAKGR